MTVNYKHLIGFTFSHGTRDCYELARDFYRDNWGIELTPYARPDDWWDQGMNLYMDHFFEEGFRTIDVHPRDLRVGDGFLISIMSEVANHCAMLVAPGKILHHRYGRLSEVVNYDGEWRRRTLATLRHPKVAPPIEALTTLDIQSLLPQSMKNKLGV